MALEVAEGAVVGDDLEAVAERLEAPARPVTAIGAGADEIAEQLRSLLAIKARAASRSSSLPCVLSRVTDGPCCPS
jgi:hypothetical protein